jgi:hypothetical protein
MTLITPDIWGPHAWKFLHYVTLGYPANPTQEQKEEYKKFFMALATVLPCSVCANHFAENYRKAPLTDVILSDREKLVRWLIDFHNIVNAKKNKPILSYEEAIKQINTNFNSIDPDIIETKKDNHHNYFIFGGFGLLVALVFIAVIYKKN